MESSENAPPSRMPRPRAATHLPTPAKGLSEMSASDHNARGGTVPATDRKHKVVGLPEPVAKRQTLVEKAGQVSRPNLAASTNSKPTYGSVRGTNSGIAKHNFSASTSTRPQSSFSRAPSTNSMASSVNSGMRPPTNARPHTAMSHLRTMSYNSGMGSRPASSMAGNAAPAEAANKRNGTVPLSISTDDRDPIIVPRAASRYGMHRARRPARVVSHESQSSSSSRSVSDPYSVPLPAQRQASLSKAFQELRLCSQPEEADEIIYRVPEGSSCPQTPSHIPRRKPQPAPKTPTPQPPVFTPSKSCKNTKSPTKEPFLSRYSNTKAPATWDTDRQMEKIDLLYNQLQKHIEGSVLDRNSVQDTVELYKTRISQLEMHCAELSTQNDSLKREVEEWRSRTSSANNTLDETQRSYRIELEDMRREHRNYIDDINEIHRREIERAQSEVRHEADGYKREAQDQMERLSKAHREETEDLERRFNRELEEERSARAKEVQELTSKLAAQRQDADMDDQKRDRELRNLQAELDRARDAIERETSLAASLKEKLTEATTNTMTLDCSMRAMKAKIDFLESDNQAQSQSFADLNQRMQEAIQAAEVANQKLIAEESLRRKLHNQVQELKGNIRVFCRVRPTPDSEADEGAKIAFPDAGTDSKEVIVQGPEQKSALGNITTANNAFSFDRVFGPSSLNPEVFEEISQLVQSALDGYNVCIFCYGQTGSGKTHTMSSADGMIPKAVQQIYSTATALEEKGWTYKMEGSFVEVYNENLNDLLGKSEELDKKKLEIRHDAAKGQTTITDVTTVVLDGPETVEDILKKANVNRSVAATKSNERSSRSHSVFILKLIGENAITGERSEGTLNLVDLAGSERIDKSGVQGARLKETQNINRSLSCLGDVIGALGQSKEGGHIPYRNSKLTYLLQFSLSGNSKTLMFVMISPLQAHLNETLTSLRFATKVHNTHIGTAKRQARVKD